ncbi:MAG: hypothetical protein SFW65_10440 [Alphaproteobacteria bacterium]|nr:hypothetical protein [Alphaproteobacteria bacterium]
MSKTDRYHVGRAARDVVQRKNGKSSNAFSPDYCLQLLGLDGAVKPFTKNEPIILSDGEIDPRTGGGVVLKTIIKLDEHKRLRSLETLYMLLQPNGRYVVSKLAELSFRAYPNYLTLQQASILGRGINPQHTDRVLRLFGALQRMHTDIRNMHFPDVGKIMEDFQIAALIGERLHLPGMSAKGGFDFQAPIDYPVSAGAQPLPYDYLPELLGLGRNDLEPMYDFGEARSKTEIDRQNGAIHNFKASRIENAKHGSLVAATTPHNARHGSPITDLIDVRWKVTGDHAVFDQFVVLGEESCKLPTAHLQKRIGIVNKAMKDLRRRRYPHVLDYIAEYDQRNLVDKRALTGVVDEHKQMVVVPFGGHNDREYLPGFGATIGGNCKGIFTYWRDANGRVQRKGVIIDLGIIFSKNHAVQASEQGNWDYVVPDIVNYLDDIDHFFATHLHADHLDGYIDYIARGLLQGKHFHATAFVCRVLEQKLKKRKVPQERWPLMHTLSGKGFVHVNAGDERVMSVYYAADSIPHSTDNTPYLVLPAPYRCDIAGNAKTKSVTPNPHYWVYGNMGDTSFGRYNLPDYEGVKPPDTGFSQDLLRIFKKNIGIEYADIPKVSGAAFGKVHFMECDPTSIHRDGFAPDVVDVEQNLCRLNEWFSDKGLILLGLSTAKRQDEMCLRFANLSQRDISVFGAYKEDRFTDMSVMGVNTNVLARNPAGKNVQAYLDWHGGREGVVPVKYFRRTAKEWHTIVEADVGRVLILGTGSQGTDIEKDAFGTQLAEFRSLLQMDPKYRPTAFGKDLRNFLVVYAQGAIPGNEETQYAQIKKTAIELDITVAVSVHEGARFYNLKEPYLSRILQDLERRGERFTREPNNGLFIQKFALYPPGHGWKEDYRQGVFPWMKKNGVGMVSAQHFGKLESPRITHELAREAGLRHPSEAISNHTAFSMRDGGKRLEIIGHLPPSFILARQNRRADKYHGGTAEYKRVVVAAGQVGTALGGLFANNNTVYTQDFGNEDYDRVLSEAQLLPAKRNRRDINAALTELPPELTARRNLPTSGMRTPSLPQHDHLEFA